MATMITEHTPRHAAAQSFTDGAALRFLLAHRLGRLMTEDIITAEPHVTPVHYVFDQRGDLVTLLPADSAHADALRRGATLSLLSVRGETIPAPHALSPASGGDELLSQVQAEVEAELIDDLDGVRDILRRQITSVLHELPQRDKSDPVERAAASTLNRMVGVRLRLLRLHPRPRPRK